MGRLKDIFKLRPSKGIRKSAGSLPFQFIGSTPLVLYNYDQEDFIKKGYAGNAEVYSIIKKITDKCNATQPYVYIDNEGVKSRYKSRRRGRTSKEGVALHTLNVRKKLDFADENIDLAKLIKQPNPSQTWADLSTLFRIFYFAQGEAFLYREAGDDDCAIELNVAPAHLMAPIAPGGELSGWQLRLMNGRTREFELGDIMHFKMPNPIYDTIKGSYRGMSPLVAGLKYLQLDDSAIEGWMKAMQNEGAKGLVSPRHEDPELWLTPEQVKDVEKAVDDKIHGSTNRNRIAVSGMPLAYTAIGLSPDALNIIAGLDKANVKLCDLWNVPAVLFDPNPTYQNLQEGRRRFVMDVILPYLNAEEDKLNNWLVQPFKERDGKEYVLDYDLSVYEELRLSPADVDAFLKTHSINEVRVMLGSDEHENSYADDIFVAQGMLPLSDYSVEL